MTKVALMGAGWAGTVHAMVASALPGVAVTWVGSRTQANAERLAAMGNVDAGTLAEVPKKVDLVVISTPPDEHAASLTTALGTRGAVLVEKPLCATLAEADAMIEAAEQSGRVVGLAENLLFSPLVDAALTHRRTMGPLTRLAVRCEQPAPTWGHFLERLSSGGVLLDLGAHPIALLLALAAPASPTSVTARLATNRDDGADDDAQVEICFDSGLVATAAVNWRGEGDPTWTVEAAASDGVIRLELLPQSVLELDGTDVTPNPVIDALPDPMLEQLGYAAQMQGIVDAAAGRGGRVCPLGFGRAVLELTCAAYLSAGQAGVPVELPFTGDRTRTPMSLWHGETTAHPR